VDTPDSVNSAVLVHARVGLRSERGLVRCRRADADLRDLGDLRRAGLERDGAGDGRAGRQYDRDVADVSAVDAERLRAELRVSPSPRARSR
jgi:hypothetical protein